MDNKVYRKITSCRICGSGGLEMVLDLGDQPPANSLRDSLEEKLPNIPLQLACCSSCAAAQLTGSVRPEYLFKNYIWVSGTAETTRKYSRIFCERMLGRLPQGKKLKILEIASNDGTFLMPFQKRGHDVLGIDPAENIVKTANSAGIRTVADFFGARSADGIISDFGKADCVFARNVVPHVENVHDVVEGMKRCLAEDGLGAIEFHYAGVIQSELHYDSIYHEHNLYLSISDVERILSMHGLFCYDTDESPISGGSLVAYFSNEKNTPTPAFTRIMENEAGTGLNTVDAWENFAEKSIEHKDKLVTAVKSAPSKIIGYGASARSSTMLNFCGMDNSILDCIADQNQRKHNKFTPGTDIKILTVEEAFASAPKSVFLLAWNFRDEILNLLASKLKFSGTVVIPFPGSVKVMQL